MSSTDTTFEMRKSSIWIPPLFSIYVYSISHFIKNNESKKDNNLYDSNSLLKTLDRINYYRYNNNKVNLMTKYSHKNIFKTLPSETIQKGSKSVKKQKIKYDNINLPMIQHIVRKKAKFKDILC